MNETLSKKLFDNFKQAQDLESSKKQLKDKLDEVVKVRDHLLFVIREQQKKGFLLVLSTPDETEAYCRNCNTPMRLEPYKEQFCSNCKGY